jgi:hypothetical protein
MPLVLAVINQVGVKVANMSITAFITIAMS